MTTKTPIAVFVYNRPDNTRHMLDTLAQCHRLDECDIVIYCDGARETSHAEGVESARKVARNWTQQHPATLIERTENLGLARSIVGGVTELCERYGQVIVIEDDLLLAPDFIDFMLQGLDQYRAVSEVMQVAGYMFPVASPSAQPFLLPLTTTWGWATWQRAWTHFQWEPRAAHSLLADPVQRAGFNLNDAYPYATMLEQALRGEIQSWGIRWYTTVFASGGLVLYPPQSLVLNNGFDGSGTNSGSGQNPTQGFNRNHLAKTRLPQPLVFPEATQADRAMLEQVRNYVRGWVGNNLAAQASQGSGRWLRWLKNRLKRMW
jgi:hypothetical protein